MTTYLVIIIITAFIFDFINGFHDAANSIATIVSTKVLTPFQAVLWAAAFNFLAYFISVYWIGDFKIADTVAKFVTPGHGFVNLNVIFAGLLAAITWNLLTWYYGIPSSSSHTLLGGFMGAALAHVGSYYADGVSVINEVKAFKTFAFIFVAPLLGMLIAYIITIVIMWLARNSRPAAAERWFKGLQLFSSAIFSLAHGLNDAQKVMGIIAAALVAQGILTDAKQIADPQMGFTWVPFTCYLMIALGTLSGGWRIIKTMGTKITKVTPLEGVSAETAGAITLFISEKLGIPVSTTHTITGAIMGVGATKRLSAVRWGVTISLLWAWIITIPISALLGGIIYFIVSLF